MGSPELGDESMNDLLRARCKSDLKALAKRAAKMLELDEADIIRIGTKRYASSIVYQNSVLANAAA